MSLARIIWPLVTLLVVIVALFFYFVYPPMCTAPRPESSPDGSSDPAPQETQDPQQSGGSQDSHETERSQDSGETGGSRPWESNFRLPSGVRPLSYRVRLHPDLTSGRFSGALLVRVAVSTPADFVALHAVGLNVTHTDILDAGNAVLPLRSAFHYKPHQWWVAVPATPLSPGAYSLRMRFAGSMTGDIVGLYMSSYQGPDGERSVYAHIYLPCDQDYSGRKFQEVVASNECNRPIRYQLTSVVPAPSLGNTQA